MQRPKNGPPIGLVLLTAWLISAPIPHGFRLRLNRLVNAAAFLASDDGQDSRNAKDDRQRANLTAVGRGFGCFFDHDDRAACERWQGEGHGEGKSGYTDHWLFLSGFKSPQRQGRMPLG
jgi:hypothetical protein